MSKKHIVKAISDWDLGVGSALLSLFNSLSFWWICGHFYILNILQIEEHVSIISAIPLSSPSSIAISLSAMGGAASWFFMFVRLVRTIPSELLGPGTVWGGVTVGSLAVGDGSLGFRLENFWWRGPKTSQPLLLGEIVTQCSEAGSWTLEEEGVSLVGQHEESSSNFWTTT